MRRLDVGTVGISHRYGIAEIRWTLFQERAQIVAGVRVFRICEYASRTQSAIPELAWTRKPTDHTAIHQRIAHNIDSFGKGVKFIPGLAVVEYRFHIALAVLRTEKWIEPAFHIATRQPKRPANGTARISGCK
jgi:hypothetical protein